MRAKLKVSDLIAEFLEEKKIKVAFGVIGSANAHIYDSIAKRGYTQIINVHHEQAAVMAMGAYYRTNGEMAAALATAGPGVVNTITGIVSCWADSIPGLIISGQESTHHLKVHKHLRMQGTQGFDIARMVESVTKYATTIRDPSTTQNLLEIAYTAAIEGRPGPILIAVPFDVQSALIPRREWQEIALASYEAKGEDIQKIVECLKTAKRPVILGGHGIRLSNSTKQFSQLVARTQIPTLLTWAAIDILATDNPHLYGKAGIYGHRCPNFVIQNCDLLLVLGSRLAIPQVGYEIADFAPKAKLIVVDIDKDELKKYEERCEVTLAADCRDVLNKLLKATLNYNFSKEAWTTQCDAWKRKYPLVMDEHTDAGFINSYRFIDKMSEQLKDDQIIVTDMGTALLSGHQGIKLKENHIMFTSTGLGEMGYGLPAAIGAAFGGNGREVLCLNCDGGMMMNLQELQTIIHYNLPIKIVIFNNDGYLMIKHTQQALFKGQYVSTNKATGVSLPDYAKVGAAFGFETYSIKSWEEFDEFQMFLDSSNPSICEVFMHPEQPFIPKVKGVAQKDHTIISSPLEEMSPLLPLEVMKDEMIVGVNPKSIHMKRETQG
jgi:acetolactate synthase-1/2/3 large subunit